MTHHRPGETPSRGLRFSIRFILIAMVGFACLFATQGRKLRDLRLEAIVAERVADLGGEFQKEVNFNDRVRINIKLDASATTKQVTRQDIESIAQLNRLQSLSLKDSGITDEMLSVLSRSRSIGSLDVSANPKITDAGLRPLENHPTLRSFDCVGTSVTNAKLRKLYDSIRPDQTAPRMSWHVRQNLKTRLRGIVVLSHSPDNSLELHLGRSDQQQCIAACRLLAGIGNPLQINISGSQLTPALVAELAALDDLKRLTLTEPLPEDADTWEQVGKLRSLESISYCGKSKAGRLVSLRPLKNLQVLDIQSIDNLDDRDLLEFRHMPQLSTVAVHSEYITPRAIRQLVDHYAPRPIEIYNTPNSLRTSSVFFQRVESDFSRKCTHVEFSRAAHGFIELRMGKADPTECNTAIELIDKYAMSVSIHLHTNQLSPTFVDQLAKLQTVKHLHVDGPPIENVDLFERVAKLSSLELLAYHGDQLPGRLPALYPLERLDTLELPNVKDLTGKDLLELHDVIRLQVLQIDSAAVTAAGIRNLIATDRMHLYSISLPSTCKGLTTDILSSRLAAHVNIHTGQIP
ncbi:hypothetical protein ACFL2H_11795 [Planctomycetota bacterium]